MITGKILDAYFAQRVDVAYSGFLDPVKKNRLFRNTMFVACDKKYLSLEDQKSFDEIAALISTEVIFKVNNNKIYTSPLQIVDITFNSPAIGYAEVKTMLPHNLSNGESVTISGVLSSPALVPNINQTFTATISSQDTFYFPLVYISGIYTKNTGQVVYGELISDYMHLYAVKCRFTDNLHIPVNISSGSSPITIFFKKKNKVRDGDQITISGMTHNTNANGTWYPKQVSSVGYQLFYDKDFQSPSTGGVGYAFPEGDVSVTTYEYAKPNFSDRKIDPFNTATVELPKYETANKCIKFYPTDKVCDEITLDYVSTPKVFVDVLDDSTDLSLYYPEKYLYFIVDMAIKLMAVPLRDTLLNQEITQELVTNP